MRRKLTLLLMIATLIVVMPIAAPAALAQGSPVTVPQGPPEPIGSPQGPPVIYMCYLHDETGWPVVATAQTPQEAQALVDSGAATYCRHDISGGYAPPIGDAPDEPPHLPF